MVVCHICGEKKKEKEFYPLPFFTKYKKQPVVWCQECQKMFMKMKKDKQRKVKLEEFQETDEFSVSFE